MRIKKFFLSLNEKSFRWTFNFTPAIISTYFELNFYLLDLCEHFAGFLDFLNRKFPFFWNPGALAQSIEICFHLKACGLWVLWNCAWIKVGRRKNRLHLYFWRSRDLFCVKYKTLEKGKNFTADMKTEEKENRKGNSCIKSFSRDRIVTEGEKLE